MFTKRHEQELAEIKALTFEVGERVRQVLQHLERIEEAQDLAPTTQVGTGEADAPGETDSAAGGGKRARRHQSRTPVATTAGAASKSGKRRDKAGAKSASAGQGRKRERGAEARKRREPAESAASSGADEG